MISPLWLVILMFLILFIISVRRWKIVNAISTEKIPDYRISCEYADDVGISIGFTFSTRTTVDATMLVYGDKIVLITGIGDNRTILFRNIVETGLQKESVGTLFFIKYRNPRLVDELYFKLDEPQKIKDFVDAHLPKPDKA